MLHSSTLTKKSGCPHRTPMHFHLTGNFAHPVGHGPPHVAVIVEAVLKLHHVQRRAAQLPALNAIDQRPGP